MRTHVVYRALDARGRVLYVGVTGNFTKRQAAHRAGAEWFADAVRWIVRGPYSREDAYAVEASLIREMAPIYNRAHNGPYPLRPDTVLVSRDTLNDYRRARRVTVRELAERVGVSHGNIGHLTSGSRSITNAATAKAISRALDCPFEAMFTPVSA